MLAALFGYLCNSVEHKHRGQRKLGIAFAEQLAPAACQQILVAEAILSLCHGPVSEFYRATGRWNWEFPNTAGQTSKDKEASNSTRADLTNQEISRLYRVLHEGRDDHIMRDISQSDGLQDLELGLAGPVRLDYVDERQVSE